MKAKSVLAAVLALVLSMSSGCAILRPTSTVSQSDEKDASEQLRALYENDLRYPFFNALPEEEQKIYLSFCAALQEHSEKEFLVGVYPSETACNKAGKRILKLYEELLYEHAEFFYANMYEVRFSMHQEIGGFSMYCSPVYLVEKTEADVMGALLKAKIDSIAAEARKQKDTFAKVLYVYDTIIQGTRYDETVRKNKDTAQIERSAFGALVLGRTVCSGYAQAFAAVMQKLGYSTGVIYNDYTDEPFSLGEGHIWNYVCLDGEYYHFDLTWDDTDEKTPFRGVPATHYYFGLTDEELLRSHTIQGTPYPEKPKCNGTKYNYFVHENASFSMYERESFGKYLEEHSSQPYIAVRFETRMEEVRAEWDLFDGKGIREYFTGGIHYGSSLSGMHLWIIPGE